MRLTHVAHLLAAVDCDTAAATQALHMLQAAVLWALASSTARHLQCRGTQLLFRVNRLKCQILNSGKPLAATGQQKCTHTCIVQLKMLIHASHVTRQSL
jgi:hypothetical protein